VRRKIVVPVFQMGKLGLREVNWGSRFQEKGMATHSNILVWRIPWTEEPGGLQSMGSQRVRQTE